MYDIEHICCLGHVHNKLQEAKKLGYKIVDFFLAGIKKLYKREKLYASKPKFYTPERIKDARNDEYTDGIVNSMHERLLDLIAKGEDFFPDKVKGTHLDEANYGIFTDAFLRVLSGETDIGPIDLTINMNDGASVRFNVMFTFFREGSP